jgi:hypothetical protein
MDFKQLAIVAALPLLFAACKKDKDPDPDPPTPPPAATTGPVKVAMDMTFGMQMLPFELGTVYTHPLTGDELNFSQFRFYLSNVRLQKSDGTWWTEPESYRIIDGASTEGRTFTIADVPAGNYTAMQYTLGVDSTRNVSGAQTGALAPANGMFWSWNTGYIMIKAEGMSPQSSTGAFSFHLGGFSGPNNIVTQKQTDFAGGTLTVGSGTPVVKLRANTARLWHNTGTSVADVNTTHMPGQNAVSMASGFYEGVMFIGLE